MTVIYVDVGDNFIGSIIFSISNTQFNIYLLIGVLCADVLNCPHKPAMQANLPCRSKIAPAVSDYFQRIRRDDIGLFACATVIKKEKTFDLFISRDFCQDLARLFPAVLIGNNLPGIGVSPDLFCISFRIFRKP